jgi:hypothetical protein
MWAADISPLAASNSNIRNPLARDDTKWYFSLLGGTEYLNPSYLSVHQSDDRRLGIYFTMHDTISLCVTHVKKPESFVKFFLKPAG